MNQFIKSSKKRIYSQDVSKLEWIDFMIICRNNWFNWVFASKEWILFKQRILDGIYNLSFFYILRTREIRSINQYCCLLNSTIRFSSSDSPFTFKALDPLILKLAKKSCMSFLAGLTLAAKLLFLLNRFLFFCRSLFFWFLGL